MTSAAAPPPGGSDFRNEQRLRAYAETRAKIHIEPRGTRERPLLATPKAERRSVGHDSGVGKHPSESNSRNLAPQGRPRLDRPLYRVRQPCFRFRRVHGRCTHLLRTRNQRFTGLDGCRSYAMYIPPFAAKIWPVVYPEILGQAIPTTVAASSSGSATLPSRVARFIASIP